jgi:small conductance mechanosensitive channel
MEGILKELQNLLVQTVRFLPQAVAGVVVFSFFWIAGIFVKKIVCRIGNLITVNKKEAFNLVGRLIKGILITFGVVMALGKMGINVTALVAGLGLTGFALGFALRDILSNVLAGALILIYHPFKLNDRINVTGLEGTVIDIDLRYTSLQADGKRILIPNSTLFTNAIQVIESQK